MQIPRNSILLCAEFVLGSSANDTARAAAQIVLACLDTLAWVEPAPKSEPITPRAGQVWQKLNIGTKTASKAPRITVVSPSKGLVTVRNRLGIIERMRIATLQRDWYCLNP